MAPKVGNKAPAFKMKTDGDESVALKALKGKKVILYFYPKNDTPGCTKEACGFRDNFPNFKKVKAVIIGISKDNTKSHEKFKAKYGLPFTLASDEDGKVSLEGIINKNLADNFLTKLHEKNKISAK